MRETDIPVTITMTGGQAEALARLLAFAPQVTVEDAQALELVEEDLLQEIDLATQRAIAADQVEAELTRAQSDIDLVAE